MIPSTTSTTSTRPTRPTKRLAAALTLVAAALIGPSDARAATPEAEATYKDIAATLGSVPEFFRAFPDYAIAGAWTEMKAVQMNPKTALSGKHKELIGLAVAAQIPCDYCVYFHTEVAKLNGATDAEIKHALAIAAVARSNSTLIGGVGGNDAETGRAVDHMRGAPKRSEQRRPFAPINDAAAARQDIERTFGFVPAQLRALPDDALVGHWTEMKALREHPDAPLDTKMVDLIALGVTAQVPCDTCVTLNTEMAKVDGANEREIRETVALAAIVRHWSTFLNGSQIDAQRFRKDVDRVVADAKKKSDRERAMGR